jgi:cyclic peptide transporter
MKLYQLLHRELDLSVGFLLFVATVAGLSNAFILVILNTAAGQASPETSNVLYAIWFLVVLVLFIVSLRYILITMSRYVEHALHRIRLRIIDKIQHAELLPLERIGRSEIYASITKEMQIISDATLYLVMMCQSAILILFALIYIAWQSLLALGLVVGFITAAVLVYLRRRASIGADIHTSMARENELFEALTHMLDGFREVRMNDLRREDLHTHLREISLQVATFKSNVRSQVAVMNIVTLVSFYFVIALVVFLLPPLVSVYSEQLAKLMAAVLFLMMPIATLSGSLQTYATATAAAENIERLEAVINQHVRSAAQRHGEPLEIRQAPFRDIIFDQVQFDYVDEHNGVLFHLGPINLSITPGETVFVTGGNGSGKSTFLHLLTCLYFPTSGEIRLDGQRLSETNAGPYRNLFTVIFYDYHLFNRLYGFQYIDRQQVDALLDRLQLQGKTRLVDNRFHPLDLSAGQRRRLALLIAYLEDKPIYVFDEWAAEQDPEFRRYFYLEILPDLKARGKTVIAVTHDDRYYHMDYVNHLLFFEEGRLVAGTT